MSQFFEEASRAGNVVTGRPDLEFGDIVIMDNCPTHHYERGEASNEFLNETGIELVYTPSLHIPPILIPPNLCLGKPE